VPERSVAVAPAPAPAPEARRASKEAPTQLAPRPLGSPPAGLPPPVGKLLASPGPGEQLPTSVRKPIAERMGVDANAVRVHSDDAAVAAASSIRARAFAYGTHVFLGPGQKPTDLGLMAHEVAHIVQQDGRATIQRSTMAGAVDGLELEARSVGTAVARGERATVVGRTGGPRVQGSFFGSIVSGIKAVGSAIADLGKAAWDAALNFIKDKAKLVPGYDLLSFILGKDPITQQPVERTALNLIKGLVSLVPGGSAMFENIQKAGVLQKIADWFGTEVEKLNLSWASIRALFEQAWNALSASDILSPSTAWEKIKKIFGPPLGRLVDFAVSAGKKLLEFIFEGAIALGGGAAQQVLGFFRRVQSVFGLIVADPVKFFANLVSAAKGGFQKFADNVVEHLKKALFNWLFGALAGAIKLPAKFDLMGIVDTVLQLLGLTYERFRERLVKVLGDKVVGYLETAFEFLKTLVTKGIAAAWDKLLEFASGLVDTVIAMIRDYVVKTIVGKAVLKLVSMFNPIGAIIQAIIGIYDTVMFFIEKAKEVAVFLSAIVDSIENIAKGNIAGAIAYVEKTLASALVVIINFLARFAGLSKIADAIKDTVKKIQDTVWKAIDKAIDWVKTKVKDLLGKKDPSPGAATTPGKPALLPEKEFDEAGEHHKVYFKVEGERATLMIASTPQGLKEFLKAAKDEGLDDNKARKDAYDAAVKLVDEIAALGLDLSKTTTTAKAGDAALDPKRRLLGDKETLLAPLLKTLLSDASLAKFNEIYLLEGLTGNYGQMPKQKDDLVTPDHQPQKSVLQYAVKNVVLGGSGPGSKTSVFKDTALASDAAGAANNARTINIYHDRHTKGRTYARSPQAVATDALDTIAKDSLGTITDAAQRAAKKRAAAIAVFKEEARRDAAWTIDVVSKPPDHAIWADVRKYVKAKNKDVKINELKARIISGEQAMIGQNFDRWL
jgi:hypothetical protein